MTWTLELNLIGEQKKADEAEKKIPSYLLSFLAQNEDALQIGDRCKVVLEASISLQWCSCNKELRYYEIREHVVAHEAEKKKKR
jgi:hypothetical protein